MQKSEDLLRIPTYSAECSNLGRPGILARAPTLVFIDSRREVTPLSWGWGKGDGGSGERGRGGVTNIVDKTVKAQATQRSTKTM